MPEHQTDNPSENTEGVDIPLQKTTDKCTRCGDTAMTRKDAQFCSDKDCPLK